MATSKTRNVVSAFTLIAWIVSPWLTPASADELQTQPNTSPKQQETPVATEDPFADLPTAPKPQPENTLRSRSRTESLFGENFGFRKEIMSQFDTNRAWRPRQPPVGRVRGAEEVLDRDVDGRQLQLPGPAGAPRWLQSGAERYGRRDATGWAFEYHNLYLDLYNILNPVLGDERAARMWAGSISAPGVFTCRSD